MDDKELQQQSGLGGVIVINGQKCTIKPLRLREMINIRNYNIKFDKSELDLNVYFIRLHLRDMPDVDDIMAWLLDLPSKQAISEVERIIKELDKLYPPEPETVGEENP